jgi:hypothetical protein
MGAFFLYRDDSRLDGKGAETVFSRKGFAPPRIHHIGKWVLWHYRKILTVTDNGMTDENGASLYACGTVIYRGLGYRDSLKRILADSRAKKIDQEQLRGSFCLLFVDGKTISILMDRSRTLHVFSNEARTCISSSFLAVLAASPTALPLNRLAVCEKLATGYIVSPDTLIDGIQQVDGEVGETYQPGADGIGFLPVLPRPPVTGHHDGVADSIARQISLLQSHFWAVDALHAESHGELGMSSGYDSRLVLACSKYLSRTMDLHTHATQGIHDEETDIVRQIASARGLALNQVTTRKMEDHRAEDIAAILDDGLYFYDGRCSHNMGAFSEVYTRAYKSRVLGAHRLGWNGLGGEMYRNYYFTAKGSVNLRPWMDWHVYYPFAPEAWGCPEEYEAMHRRKVEKMARRLGPPDREKVDALWLRRYYSEIRMPDCDAANNDALNQLIYFHTPFMDAALVAEAINATAHIGWDGTYQARLIREIDPNLAAFQTHYGHALDRIPLPSRLHAWAKCQMPDSLKRSRLRMLLRRAAPGMVPEFLAFAQTVPILGEIREALCSSVLRGRFEEALIHYAQRPTALFVGSFLCAFDHKIHG